MTALERFQASLHIDYEKWHDGVGFDLEAIRGASPEERAAIEGILLSRGTEGWREVEALAALGTPRALEALRAAAGQGRSEVRAAVMRYAPEAVTAAERTAALVHALEHGTFGDGLSEAIDLAAEHHPPEVIEALLRGAARGSGDRAVHFAALLLFVHGKTSAPFDWAERPFFLRFADGGPGRDEAFRDLCARLGVEPARHLTSG
ncbi:MAG: hypothetical protein U0229_05855 [Anaeromyxobacter sp.]